MFDKFCVISLAYRNDGFIVMLAPIRNYLFPKDPLSAPLLCSTKERSFSRLSANIEPARWIASEDANVEHLLDMFATADPTSGSMWDACADFMKHLWHKPRLVVLARKIEALADDHPSKPECLYQLSQLFQRVENHLERSQLPVHALILRQERGNDHRFAQTLRALARVHLELGLYEEGMQ